MNNFVRAVLSKKISTRKNLKYAIKVKRFPGRKLAILDLSFRHRALSGDVSFQESFEQIPAFHLWESDRTKHQL